MIKLDFSSTQKIIFENNDLQKLLPKFKNLFNQWKLARIHPQLKPAAQKAVLDFINKIDKESLDILENYLKDNIVIKKIDYNIVKNWIFAVDDLPLKIEEINDFDNLFISRDENQVYIGSWK